MIQTFRLTAFIQSIFLLLSLSSHAQQSIKKWEVVELSFTARNQYFSPYTSIPVNNNNVMMTVEFKGLSGEAQNKSYSITGFWDGGQLWKARFAPPASGQWEYKSISRDPGLNNKKGKLEVVDWSNDEKNANATRRGFLYVMQSGTQAGHFFQYADGTPFLWIGDTWWNWTQRRIKLSTFKTLADDRSAKGFNVGQLFVAANGWGQSGSLLDSTYSLPDINLLRKVDTMIAYANSKGITVWVHGWWSRVNLNNTAGEEKIKRWWRYLVNRYSAYNVIWVVAGEYNMFNYGGLGLPFWKDLGRFIKDEDPYKRIVSTHNTPPGWDGGADAPQWSTAEVLHNEKWLDYNQSQVGHGRWYNEMIPPVIAEGYKKQPAKPIVVTEPWYEFVQGNPTAKDIRFALYGAILSGAAGHTYGGGHVWLAHVPESPSGGGPWPLEKGFENNTLNYPGAVSMGYAASFFKKTSWWTLAPHPELLHEYPDKYCMALPGNEYIIYLRWGGGVKVDLQPSSANDVFEYYWFNPDNNKYYSTRTTNGGVIRYFSCPEGYPGTVDYKDWILYIRKK
jgi:hypothetical protein